MSAGPVRRTLARLAGAAGAVGMAIILIVFGPPLADLPAGAGDVPHWFAEAPERGLVTIVAAIAWLCLLWLCLGVLLGVAAAIPGGVGRISAVLARLVLPRAMRRLVELGLGVTLAAGVAPVMAAVPALAASPASPAAVSASAVLPDLSRAADPGVTVRAATPTVAAAPGQATAVAAEASPRVTVPGLGASVPVVDLAPTTPAADSPASSARSASAGGPSTLPASLARPGATTPPRSPEAAQGVAPEHTAPDPGTPVRLTTARLPASWPDLTRPSTQPASPAGPSTAPTGPAPAGGASTASGSDHATRPPSPGTAASPSRPNTSPPPSARPSAPSRDPVVPPAHRGTGVPATGAATGGEEIVVLRGDSLWTIAARHLGPTATHEQIAAEWPRWWAANADLIGHDPNVILPGQRLRPPSGP